ncbi:DNA-binding response regulator [Pseudonocardiaceae bacterium YIM PH 21723]|nr:DNA-binding response regulator [Pseudonocardiaceae bacterium YIM PH 21723]
MTIRVLIAEDTQIVRAGIAMLLAAEDDIEVIAEAGNGREAIERARVEQPDVVLMDLFMPEVDGVVATRQVTADGFSTNPDRPVKVLILTSFHIDDTVYLALRAGASGFLLKDAAPNQLVSAVRSIAAGDAWLAPAVARNLLNEFASRPDRNVPTPTELQQLTQKEREVLTLVAHGLSNKEIAEHQFVAEATIKTHFSRVLMKLGLRDRAQAVVAAYQSGLVQRGDHPPRANQ